MRPSGCAARTRTLVLRRRLCARGDEAPSMQTAHVGGSAVRQAMVGTWLDVPAAVQRMDEGKDKGKGEDKGG